MTHDEWFASPTWGRRPNLDIVADLVASRFPHGGGLIVEVGSIRTPGNVEGDGCATVCWGDLGRRIGAPVVSIDLDAQAVEWANRLRRYGYPVFGVVGRGEDVIRSLGMTPILLLYLDGSNDPQDALAELLAAQRVQAGGVVMVDDASPKGRIVEQVMAGVGRPIEGLDPKWNQKAWEVVG